MRPRCGWLPWPCIQAGRSNWRSVHRRLRFRGKADAKSWAPLASEWPLSGAKHKKGGTAEGAEGYGLPGMTHTDSWNDREKRNKGRESKHRETKL
jgi:hypothetical protein